MFPTAGYFRSTNCPFFVHGLCHRPYCHFRHSKPGLKSSKSRISPHKNNTEQESHSIKTKTPSPDGSNTGKQQPEVAVGTLPEEPTRKMEMAKGTSQDNENKYTASTNTTASAIKGILKRTNEEQSASNQQSSVEESSLMTSLDKTKPVTSCHILSSNDDSLEISELDDYEQPFASLTDEEKKIIGLTALPSSGDSHDGDFVAVKSTDSKHSSASNHSSHSVSQIDSSVVRKLFENETEDKGVAKINQIDVNAAESNIVKEARVEQIKTYSLNKRLKAKGVEKTDEKQVVCESDVTDKKQEHTVGKEKSVITGEKPRKRKSVQLQISVEGGEDKKQLLDITAKKRKSQQLPCVTSSPNNCSAFKNEDGGKAIKRNESHTHTEATLHALFLSASKSLEHTVNSRKSILGDSSQDVKKHKAVSDSPVKLKNKLPDKQLTTENAHAPKKKRSLSETEINFFGSAKKTIKTEKLEKQKKSKDKVTPVKTLKPQKIEKRGSEKKKSLQRAALLTTANITISSDDSDMCSAADWDSSQEEDDSLKRIWDDFELPQNDIVMEKDLKSPIKNQTQESPRKRTLPSVSKDSEMDKQPSMADALGLGKKQRVAHTSSHLPRRLSSNANPVRRYPKTLSAVQKKEEPVTLPTSESPTKDAVSYKPAKQRVAHVLKKNTPAGSLPRPRIPVEYGAKVPQSQRQRYLDRIVDEYLRICSTEKEAFEKAVEEENALYERSTRRQVYLNLCVNAIKKLRGITQLESPSPVKTETITKVAVTKTLSSGAVLVSTKSPAKQQPAVSERDQFTEEVMYDFLSKYLMSEEDLVENGYPRPCPTAPGRAVIKTKKEQSKDPSRRTCRRCGRPFVVLEDGHYLTREECVYHAGKLFRRRGEPITNYSCCQGDAGSPGCCVGKVHVCDNVNNTEGFMTTIVSPLADQRKKIFSMDCEMCYTTAGLELTRITVVNWNLEQVYDSFVVPERTIVDYNTRFSGVTEDSLRGVTTTIHEVQAVLLSMIHKDTILVGHSLESDLKATKLIHSKVVDTSVVFPHRLGLPYKRALRNLMAEHLKKIIQDSVDGHDSHEDASACLELMRWKVKEDMKKTSRQKSPRQALVIT